MGLNFKVKKMFFRKTKSPIFGSYSWGGEIFLVPKKIEVIRLMPEPSTKKLLRSFLGMCGYYRSFIPLFSEIAAPLTELTKGGKSGKICFDDVHRRSFCELKDLWCSSHVLGVPRYDRSFQIQCDASDFAVGDVSLRWTITAGNVL